jgi:transcriptional regulator with XRE-family HTH domain
MTSEVMTARPGPGYAWPMQPRTQADKSGAARFGPALRGWRTRRGLSQERLAEEAQVSTRHLSFLETGRAAPSRDMVLVLSSALDLPLRERNELLSAAGFAGVYSQDALDAPAMSALERAVSELLTKLDPYPAVVVDRAWNAVRMNAGAQRFLPLFLPPDAPPEVARNLVRAVVHPKGARPFLVNWEQVVRAVVERARHDAARDPEGSVRRALVEEALAEPGVLEALRKGPSSPPLPFLPLHVRRDGIEARFFTLLTTIGTPLDVTAEELAIEAYFPADDATRALLTKLSAS